MAAWKKLEDVMNKKGKKYFPKPWNHIEASQSGIGNVGAEMFFGTVANPYPAGARELPAMVIIFHSHKDIVGYPYMYWYIMWHKDYGYIEFDIRWIWKFLGEARPDDWMKTDYCVLKALAAVRETLLRCPEDRRNELIANIGTGKFMAEEEPWPGTA
jgi:hypothetical protein